MEMQSQKPRVTPKDFFLWVAAMAALYASVVSFITLLFRYIDFAFPDPALEPYYYADPYSGPIRFAIASLIVLFPLFLVLMRLIRRDIARDPSRAEVWVRRWVLFLTLFIAGVTLAVDLITLINTFLGGELTTRFILKVVVVFLVVGAAFLHFLSDLRGYWNRHPERAKMVGYGAALAIILSIVGGFFIIGSPADQRAYRIDEQRVGDLQNIQWQIVSHYQQKSKLPQSLSELEDSISGYRAPVDQETGAEYAYRVTASPYSFELCAVFTKESRDVASISGKPVPAPRGGIENSTWEHGIGQTCFERTIDPDLYPPLKGKI